MNNAIERCKRIMIDEKKSLLRHDKYNLQMMQMAYDPDDKY